METINISKASTLANLFYLFFHGGKAAIIPFLTLFFRLVGLNAIEAGGIIAAKTITGLVWAPLWARCATVYNRQRLVLMFALFMMILTYLSFPALYTQVSRPGHCWPAEESANTSLSLSQGSVYPPTSLDNTTLAPANSFSTSSQNTEITKQGKKTTIAPVHFPQSTQSHTAQEEETTRASKPKSNEGEEKTTPASGEVPSHTLPTSQSTSSPVGVGEKETERKDLYNQAVNVLTAYDIKPEDIEEGRITAHDLYIKLKDKGLDLTEKEATEIFEIIGGEPGQRKSRELQKRSSSSFPELLHRETRTKLSDLGDFGKKLQSIRTTLQADHMLLTLVILAIVVAGEIFASPVEKIADDAWFDFLNRIDDLERYGQQRFWGSIAFVLIPVFVTVTVDNTPCFLPFNIHHYLLHFYIFAILMGAAMVVSCCYPVPPPANSKYVSKICKGLQAVCCDCRGFLFSITLLLSGASYASFHNFLFWRIQDLGGSEFIMGLCVSIGAFAEIPMLILSGRLVKRLGNSWVVSLALLTLSLRVLYYSFIQLPWAILPLEITHGVTHTTLWFAILSYDDFNIGAAVDRSIRSILSSFYFGFGFSLGSVVSGFLFHTYGSSVLFWGVSAVTGGWCLIFSVAQKCIPKKEKVRYIKLLRTESDDSDDEEDDWLEMALKES